MEELGTEESDKRYAMVQSVLNRMAEVAPSSVLACALRDKIKLAVYRLSNQCVI